MSSKIVVAGFFALAGLALLAVGAQLAPVQNLQPAALDDSFDNHLVIIEGKLQSKWQLENGWRLRVCSKGCIVVIVDEALEQQLQSKGREIEATTVGQRVTVSGWARRTPAGWRLFPRSAGSLQT